MTTPGPSNTLHIALLGSLQILRHDTPVHGIESDKTRALLAYLLVESDRAHRREALAILLWPDAPAPQARRNLRQALHNLRTTLEEPNAPPFFVTDRQSIAVNRRARYRLDVDDLRARLRGAGCLLAPEQQHHRAELALAENAPEEQAVGRLQEALALYRGPFLAGFTLPDSDLFEEWRALREEELRMQTADGFRRLAAHHTACGRHADAVRALHRLIELEPWAEEAYRALMRAHASQGDRAAALRTYRTLHILLEQEFQVAPEDETEALYREIRYKEIRSDEHKPTRALVVNPYKGLAPYAAADAAYFFGREGVVETLITELNSAAEIVLSGPPGSGKTSLISAGLLPRLLRHLPADASDAAEHDGAGHVHGGREKRWLGGIATVERAPFEKLAVTLFGTQQSANTEPRCRTDLPPQFLPIGKMDAWSRQWIAQAVASSVPDDTAVGSISLLLIIDQFERLFQRYPATQIRAFVVGLRELQRHLTDAGIPMKLIIVARTDVFDELRTVTSAQHETPMRHVTVPAMTDADLRAAIIGPARLFGVDFESGLADRIITELGTGNTDLSLPSLTLTRLWEQREHDRLSHSGYRRIGRLACTLIEHAEQIYTTLTLEEKRSAKMVLLRLIHPAEGQHGRRRLAYRREFEEFQPVVQRLVDMRLIRTVLTPDGQTAFELTHMALVENWSRLHHWLRNDRLFYQWREQLSVSIQQWEESGRDEQALIRGPLLRRALEWLAVRAHSISLYERVYIETSHIAAKRVPTAERDKRTLRAVSYAAKQIEAENDGG